MVHLGGQAVVEGVMMRNKNKVAIAVRKPDNKIKTIKFKYSLGNKKIPFIRGILILIETLLLGIKALFISAEQQETKKHEIKAWEIGTTIGITLIFTIGLFIFLPLLLSRLITSKNYLINLLDGIFRIIIFIGYLTVISLSKEIKKVFQYHGAEHKVVHCYEDKKPLTIKNCKKYSALHPRCGTAFIFIVLILSILLFSLITFPDFWHKFLARLILIPVIAALGYEILHFTAKHKKSKLLKILIAPGLAIQKITTKNPNAKQLQVAIAAAKKVI